MILEILGLTITDLPRLYWIISIVGLFCLVRIYLKDRGIL